MGKIIVDKTIDFIQKYTTYKDKDLDKIRYGFEGVYLTITKIVIIILIGVIFKYLDIVITTILFFNILRFFAFGLHAKKSWHCLILSIINFNILPYIINYISTNNLSIIIIGIIAFISFLLFAPADTEKRPLKNKRKRIIRKVSSLCMSIIFTIISLFFPVIKASILSSLIIESLMVNPITYKLLGLTYNNYKHEDQNS